MAPRTWLDGHSDAVLCCAVLPGGEFVASGSEAGQVCVHDMEAGSLASCIDVVSASSSTLDTCAVSSMCCSATKPCILYAAAGPTVHVIDTRVSGGPVQEYPAMCRDDINQVAVNVKATHLATADDAGDIKVLDLTSGQVFKTLTAAHGGQLAMTVAFRPHRPWELLTGGMDSTVARWDFARGKCLDRWSIAQAGAGPDNDDMAQQQQQGQLFNPPFVHGLAVPDVPSSCRPWCQLAGVASGDGRVVVFDADAGDMPPGERRGGGPAASGSTGRPGSGRGKAGGAWDGPRAWGQEQGGHARPVACVAFAPGVGSVQREGAARGTPPGVVVSGGEDRRLLFWDLLQRPHALHLGQQEESSGAGHADGALATVTAQAGQGPVHEVLHGRKINCVAPGTGPSSHMLCVGCTRRRLCMYDLRHV